MDEFRCVGVHQDVLYVAVTQAKDVAHWRIQHTSNTTILNLLHIGPWEMNSERSHFHANFSIE